MRSSPEDKPFLKGAAGPDGRPWMHRMWSPEEWDLIPPDRRPREVMRFGSGRAELVYGDRANLELGDFQARGPIVVEGNHE